jgi:hypothetical protein
MEDGKGSALRLQDGNMDDVPSDIMKPGPVARRGIKACEAHVDKKRKKGGYFSAKDAGDALASFTSAGKGAGY